MATILMSQIGTSSPNMVADLNYTLDKGTITLESWDGYRTDAEYGSQDKTQSNRTIYMEILSSPSSSSPLATYSENGTMDLSFPYENGAGKENHTCPSLPKTFSLNSGGTVYVKLYFDISTSSTIKNCILITSGISIPAGTYSVTYNKNTTDTVSSLPSEDTKEAGKNLTLSSTKPVRTGYNFVNWNTAANGTGDSYSSGGTYSKDEDVTLYAQWSLKTYTITYAIGTNNVGSVPEEQTKDHFSNLTLRSTMLSIPTGYYFQGWSSTNGTKEVEYAGGATYSTEASITLYPVWKYGVFYYGNNPRETYTSTYNIPSSQVKEYNVSVTLNSLVPLCYSYQFLRWNTAENNTGTSYNPSATYSGNTPLFLYAAWQCVVWSKNSAEEYVPGVLYRKTSDGYVATHVSYKGSSSYNNPNGLG